MQQKTLLRSVPHERLRPDLPYVLLSRRGSGKRHGPHSTVIKSSSLSILNSPRIGGTSSPVLFRQAAGAYSNYNFKKNLGIRRPRRHGLNSWTIRIALAGMR